MHKDGREVWVEAQSIVVCDESGPVGMRGVTMDITAAVEAEIERADFSRVRVTHGSRLRKRVV
jgi:hypothetical protein